MNKIKVLDCTLRDGGYCNQWRFGYDNIRAITSGLVEANIDVIECGFLTSKTKDLEDVTKFSDLSQVTKVIPPDKGNSSFVVMMNYGEYDAVNLKSYAGGSVEGIRVAFHKKNIIEALKQCRIIGEKGYKVFVQAMVSLNYSDEEFLDLISRVNQIEPYAFYIVDSFGMMKTRDLTRLFYMVEHNLKNNIWIGFHSHNNMQLAYSNAQCLIGMKTNRNLIIDSSVYGMGRGAGNLNTELFVGYLNENNEGKYQLTPLLRIIDHILYDFHERNYWGYSLPNYISASHNAHPNYAGYLDNKKTLTIEDMNEIFKQMDDDKKMSFDKDYVESLYFDYMEKGKIQKEHEEKLLGRLRGATVLLIAPGKSSECEKEKIINFQKMNSVISISVNFEYTHVPVEYIFLSNIRRYRELGEGQYSKCIVTSNIPEEGVYYKTSYRDLLNDEARVRDNAGLMAIKFLILQGVGKIVVAGFDGYSHSLIDNFGKRDMYFFTSNIVIDDMNAGMGKVLSEYKKEITIEFLTVPKFLHITE